MRKEAASMNVELSASLGTVVATMLLVVVPGVVYAWYVLELWIGDSRSYADAVKSVER
jgi:hypothetical protein